jgi:UDP-2,3-diacylglucosamine hydrolase
MAGATHDQQRSGSTQTDLQSVALIASDVHLGAVPDATEAAFLDFLRWAPTAAGALVLNGDIFDVWFASRRFVPRRHAATLASIADVVRQGLDVSFIGGNRDAVEWGGEVLARETGVRVLADPARITIVGRRALIAHGDGARWGATRPYTKPYPWLRHPALVGAVRTLLPQEWLFRELSARSPTRRRVAVHAAGGSTGPKRRAPQIEAWARAELARDASLDLIVAGHSHHPSIVEVEPGRFYVNAGDWIEHHTYVVIRADSAPALHRWPSREVVSRG